jgi:diadenylate cyclase
MERVMPKGESDFADPIIAAATTVAKAVSARVLFVYISAVDDIAALRQIVKKPTELVLVCRDDQDLQRAKDLSIQAMKVPDFDLSRMGQIKMATLIAFSQQILDAGDVFVFLTGVMGHSVDTLVTMRVGEEYELFQSVGQPKLTEHIRRPVFEKVLRLALELAHEGREGKPVGALFVLGDYREVQKYCLEGRINPFKGYTEKQRNILDDSIGDTVKEIAKLDGAFVLKGTGVIMSACAILRPAIAGEALPQGMGSRHAAAAAITANTKSIAITLSESTCDVRIWRLGTMITEIEKSPRPVIDGTIPPSTKMA